MTTPTLERADRLLVWLFVLTLIFGGLATIAVVLSADAVLAGLSRSAAEQPAGDGHAMPMDMDHSAMSMDEHMAMTPPAPNQPAAHDHAGMTMPGQAAPVLATVATTP